MKKPEINMRKMKKQKINVIEMHEIGEKCEGDKETEDKCERDVHHDRIRDRMRQADRQALLLSDLNCRVGQTELYLIPACKT